MEGAVLVAGASGYLGRRVVAELRRRGARVRALVHAPSTHVLSELAAVGVDIVTADATRPGTLVGGTPEAVDRDATISLFQEAAATRDRAAALSSRGSGGDAGGVRRFLLVATFEGREARASVPLQRAKEEAVDHVRLLAAEHGMYFTILRPTAYFKDFTDLPWQRMQRSCWMLVPGGGRARCNPIDGAELATFIADCVLDPTAQRWSNKEVRIGGPQVLTFQDVIWAAAEALGRRRERVWLVPLPPALLRALASLAGLLGGLWHLAARLSGGLRFLAYSSTHDAVGDVRWGSRTVADHYHDLAAQQALPARLSRQPSQADRSE